MKKWIVFIALITICAWPVFGQVTHGIQWTWPAVTTDTAGNTITVDGYNIYCAVGAAGPFTTKSNAALLTTPTFLETSLTVGNTYFCQTEAVKGALTSTRSATSSGVTFLFPPAAPVAPQGVVQ